MTESDPPALVSLSERSRSHGFCDTDVFWGLRASYTVKWFSYDAMMVDATQWAPPSCFTLKRHCYCHNISSTGSSWFLKLTETPAMLN
jgi:hypothetical protein